MTVLTLAITALLAAPAAAQTGSSDRWDARLTAFTGDVVVHPADGGADAAAEVGMPLEEGDRVVTGAGAEAEVALDGGSLITLRENSDFKLEQTGRAQSAFSLAFGSLLAKIQKLGTQSLAVRTPSSVAAVRGTEFGVEVLAGHSHVGVFDEGRVEVSASGGMTVLTPNQETSVADGAKPGKAVALNRFLVHRARMKRQLRRLEAVRADWKNLSSRQREKTRRQALKRLREQRRQWLRRNGRPVERREVEEHKRRAGGH